MTEFEQSSRELKRQVVSMLERLAPSDLGARLGFTGETDSPDVGPIARTARVCVTQWRAPQRQRVTSYLLQQLVASGFDEEPARDRVRDVIDGLIDIGDLTAARLDGKGCIALSLPIAVGIGPTEIALLGTSSNDIVSERGHPSYLARRMKPGSSEIAVDIQEFREWVGTVGYVRHLTRRAGTQSCGTLREFWSCLVNSVRQNGNPMDHRQVRAVIAPSNERSAFFGRHNTPTVSGRWSTEMTDGIWCGVRPGRNANEWHPVLVEVSGDDARSLDMFNWDEWSWALLARGEVLGSSERASWNGAILSFHYPIPDQFGRAMRLLGGRGERSWTWNLTEAAHACFNLWRTAAL